MSTVAIDRLLAVLVVALAGSGLLSLRSGAPSDAWLFVLHGLLGGLLAATVVLKLRRSVPRAISARRWGRLGLSLAIGLVAVAALVGGFAWVASGRILSIGAWTVLTLHAWAGLVLVPLVLVHVLPRRWRLLRPRRRAAVRASSVGRRAAPAGPGRAVSRRAVLASAFLAAISAGLVGAAEVADRLQGGVRRFTGSRWLPPGGVPPPTTFFGEPTPAIDPGVWRIRVHGSVTRELDLSPADLASLPTEERVAVLDCTSGWALETTWRGVPIEALLEQAGTTGRPAQVLVRSVTGWATTLDAAEIDRALLASHVAGRPLPDDNGAPFRLVVPDRRGLDWVKWVAEIEVG